MSITAHQTPVSGASPSCEPSSRLAIYHKIAAEHGGIPDRFVRIAETTQITSLSNTRLFQMEKTCTFPKRIRLGHRCSGYRLSDVLAWLADPVAYNANGDASNVL